MLQLDDFVHLSQVDRLIEQLVAEDAGLILVTGLDPRPLDGAWTGDGFLPSGRSTILRILVRQVMEAQGRGGVLVVAKDRTVVRVPRRLRRRVRWLQVQPPRTYAHCVAEAVHSCPGLLVMDHLGPENASLALEAARSGVRVISQLDTIFCGAEVVRHLLDMGVTRQQLGGLTWVVTVGRRETLCPHCKRPVAPDSPQLGQLRQRFPEMEPLEGANFFRVGGCAECHQTGRAGDIATFDIWHADQAADPLSVPSQLSLQTYVLHLASQGQLAIDDVLRLDAEQLRRTYYMLTASQTSLAEANASLQRKLAELEAANRVLQGRTEALISLQDIGQALIAFSSLEDLAARVCRHARDLCSADRAILYYMKGDLAQVLAVSGWDPALLYQELAASQVFHPGQDGDPVSFAGAPPGVSFGHPDVGGVTLRAGLRVPLIAQGKQMGTMIVHTTQRADFTPGQVALLRTFANQAALAMQRAGLIEALQEKVAQLEAAQAELVKKERLEREMELARQVQQSVLPHVFPTLPGYTFAAHNRPARQVGGDFYDVIDLDAERFGIVIADVSDKGMPAALYMALTRSLILAEARRECSPQTVLSNVHRLLLELGQPDMFVTVFYGVVKTATRQLTYARAGHDRPLLLRRGSVQCLEGEGIFLGFPDLEDLNLTQERLDLLPGDRLVLYTDGLTDAQTPDGQFFGTERLSTWLAPRAGLLPDELCQALFDALDAYQGGAEQFDDMTLLVVGVEPVA